LKSLDEKMKTAKTSEEQQTLLRIKFGALYNLGVHFQAAKDPEQALNYYQQALELYPDSKEIKTNIEMMFRGGGSGKGEPNKDQKGEGQEGDQQQDQQPKEGDQGKKPQPQGDQQDKNKKNQFDQKQMSMEDLNRIMEELKQQEQNIRAKVNKKGAKSEAKDKEW
jgi:TPR repeat protein